MQSWRPSCAPEPAPSAAAASAVSAPMRRTGLTARPPGSSARGSDHVQQREQLQPRRQRTGVLADPAAAERGAGDVKGSIQAAEEWLRDTFGSVGEFGHLDMISAFSEGARWAERQAALS